MRVARGGKITRRAKKALLGLIASFAALLVAGAVYQAVATEADERRYPSPGEMVDIGGHELHIICAGEGDPTVVLESGRGESSLAWSWVQPELAQETRVCVYDRAGLGWSEPSSAPRDSRHIAEELHVLLNNAGIEGPYVLVGHSSGGFHARVFADRYPGEVAGVVLVDSAHEDEPFPGAEVSPEVPKPVREAVARENAGLDAQLDACRVLSPFGGMRVLVRLVGAPGAAELPTRVRPEAEAVFNRASVCGTTAREAAAMADSASQAREAGPLGDVPLIVLSSGAPLRLEELSPEEAEQQEALGRALRAWQEDLVEVSILESVPHASHSGTRSRVPTRPVGYV